MQVRILILVAIGAMFFGQALYNFFKNQRRQANAHRRPKQQPRRQQTEHRPRQVMGQQPQVKPAAKPQPFLAGESIADSRLESSRSTIDEMTASAETSPPDTTTSESTAPPTTADHREDLRRAVIWSEILQRKF